MQGWIVRDPSVSGPGPVLLDVHGGPHNAWNGAADPAHLYHQELAARGWTVLIVNPRASDGYGEAFYAATIGARGTADARVSAADTRGAFAAMSSLTRVGDVTTLVLPARDGLCCPVGQAQQRFTALHEGPAIPRASGARALRVALTPGSVRSRPCHTCPSARLRVFNAQHQSNTRNQYRVRKLAIQ